MNFYSKVRISLILLIVSVSVSNSLAQETLPDSLAQKKIISSDSLIVNDSLNQQVIINDSLSDSHSPNQMLTCTVISQISPTSVTTGPGAGQISPTITVTTSPLNCTTYSMYSDGWIHPQAVPGRVLVSVDALYGPTRYGTVHIGGYTLNVTQTCGSNPVAPSSLSVNRNNFCANAGGTITLTANGGSGVYTRWFTGSCGGTQVGYTSGASVSITAPTTTTTYYGRWETGCGNSGCAYITVNVNQPPVISSISGTASVCPGTAYRYTASNTGLTTYNWSIPTGASGSSSTYYIDVTFGTTSGNVTVSGTDSNGCTSNTASYGVTASYLNQYLVIGTGTTCPGVGTPVSLQGSTNGIVYKCYLNGSWQSGDMITGNGGNNVTWNKYSPGTYTIKGVSGGCEIPMSGSAVISNYTASTDPTSVTANANPMCYGAGTTLTVHGGSLGTNANWNWYTAGCGVGTPVGTGPTLNINPPTTTTYWVKPVGLCGTNGCASITITVTNTPVIAIQPVDVHICDGASASFSVSASGTNSYQWQTSPNGSDPWTNISGATSSTYSIPSANSTGPSIFRCAVTNTCFTTYSDKGYIFFSTLYPYTVLGDTTICPGDQHKIRLNGSDPNSAVIYKLFLNGTEVTQQPVHGTGGPISFPNGNAAGVYTVKGVTVSPQGCLVLMNGSATVIVRASSTQPTSVSATRNDICPGEGSKLTLIGGSIEPGYGIWHWYSGSIPCGSIDEGSNTTSIDVNPNTTTNYSVRAEGGCVTTSCTYIQLNVKQPTTISTHPLDSYVSFGSDASFSVTATGPNLQYLWQISPDGVNWTDITGLPGVGFLTPNLIIKGSTVGFEDNSYRCKVSSECTTIYSNAGKIVLEFPESNYLTGNNIPDPETRTLNTSYLVGATNGSFNVNPMGGSSYTVPIGVPLGVNGLAPEISLVYSSNSGTGVAGYGWQIGGLSAVTRGPQTIYNDGNAGSVNLDANDRFYLDGQRLVNTSGNYGTDGSQYRTENEIFTRVTQSGDDPSWFKAETKSGLIYEYGNSQTSKQIITGFSPVLNWYISRVSDQFGNQINFTYIKDHNNIFPYEITYGLNTITFYYKSRGDHKYTFLQGKKIEQDLLLDKITIKTNSVLLKTYEFKQSYQAPYEHYSILNEIIEYGINGSRLNSTAFSYQLNSSVDFQETTYNQTQEDISYKSRLYTGDFNGDGRADFLCLPDISKGATWTGMRVYTSDGDDQFTLAFSSTNSLDLNYLKDLRVIDLNADGIDDIVYERGSTSVIFYYMICNGTSFSSPVSINTQTYNVNTGLSGKTQRVVYHQEDDNERTYSVTSVTPFKNQISSDYNGDGVNDIFLNDPNGNYTIWSFMSPSGQLTQTLNVIGSGTISTMNGKINSGDFNGDGKSEIWSIESSITHIYALSGTSLTLVGSSNNLTNTKWSYLGDFNGDGKVDYFVYGDGNTDYPQWSIYLSTGNGFIEHQFNQMKANMKDDYVRIGDFNGDGMTDLMVSPINQSSTDTYFYITMNSGTSMYSHQLSGYPPATHNYNLADYDGDGRTDFICTSGEGLWIGYQLFRTTGPTSILMEKVANGLGQLTKISYMKLSEADAYYSKRGTGAIFPVTDFQGPWSAVIQSQTDNGKGSLNTVTYSYTGAKIHLQGRGFLGYSKILTADVTSGIASGTINGYNLTYFYPVVLKSFTLSGDTLQTSSNTWQHNVLDESKKRILPYIQSTVQKNFLTGDEITATAQYDDYGDPTSVIKSYLNGPTVTTTNGYTDDIISPTKWLIGRPTSTTTVYSGNSPSITRTVTRIFDTDNNHLTSETYFPGTEKQFIKSYQYYTNGNLQTETASSGGVSRTNSRSFESDNIRLHSSTDPLAHETLYSYDDYGRLHSEQDFLGNTRTYQYDNLNRQISETSSLGSQSGKEFSWYDSNSDPALTRYSILETSNSGAQKKTWYDDLGRIVQSGVKGFTGTWIYTSTTYNVKGQVESISEPYFESNTPLLNYYAYDDFGRKTNLTQPSGLNTTWLYSGHTTSETIGEKTSSKTISSDGTISSATDEGGEILYTYYNDGKVKTITAPGGIVTSMEYDIAGNETLLSDPSAGSTTYTYNGFGELTEQHNAKGQITNLTYNDDGRPYQKTSTEGTTSYSYNSNKQLTGISSPGSISRSIAYDNNTGRIMTTTETVPGSTAFTTSITYDNIGRIDSITHPSGIVETKHYNSNGYLSSIEADGVTVWTISTLNERQQLTSGRYGNSLTVTLTYDSYGFPTSVTTGDIQHYSYNFDAAKGTLTSRQNNKYTGLTEQFHYDDLDRLDSVTMGLTTIQRMNYHTDKGVIIEKSDAGSFAYEHTGKPYQISSIDPSTGLISTDQSLTYTSFLKINTVSESSDSASFLYNADEDRAKMIVLRSESTILTRWYPSQSYIKEISASGTKEYTFIGGDAYSAPVVALKHGDTLSYYYLLRDYLGSITHVVDATKSSVVSEYSYDAWGRMRNPATWEVYDPGSEPELFVAGRGFTGHEHLHWFNLINMNGRVYDPLIAMFLSPDNYVQNPDFTQNFNRYGYCLNNPLKYSDPSGEFSIFIPILLFAGEYAINWLSNVINNHESPKEAFKNTPIIIGVQGTIASIPQKIIPQNYGSNGSGISESDIDGIAQNNSTNGYLASLNGIYAPEFISLGIGEPFLTKETSETPEDWYARYQLVLNVFGSMYDRYNWIQTAQYQSDPVKLDMQLGDWGVNHGFYYNKFGFNDSKSRYLSLGSNMFFQDYPNANSFDAELTLCGRKSECWYSIATFNWGYSIVNSKVNVKYFNRIFSPSNKHLEWVSRILDLWNSDFNLNW